MECYGKCFAPHKYEEYSKCQESEDAEAPNKTRMGAQARRGETKEAGKMHSKKPGRDHQMHQRAGKDRGRRTRVISVSRVYSPAKLRICNLECYGKCFAPHSSKKYMQCERSCRVRNHLGKSSTGVTAAWPSKEPEGDAP